MAYIDRLLSKKNSTPCRECMKEITIKFVSDSEHDSSDYTNVSLNVTQAMILLDL